MPITKVKIKHKDKRHWGKQLNIPHDGTVAIGKAGTTQMSEKAAKLLLTKSASEWEEIAGEFTLGKTVTKGEKDAKSGSKKAAKVTEPVDPDEDLEEADDEEIDEEDIDTDEEVEDDGEQQEAEVDADELEGMDLENLVNIATTSEIPGWEKFRNNEKALRTFLKNRLNS